MTIIPIEDEPILCPLFCGAERHDEPKAARFGMTCPGHDCTAVEQSAFEMELAWRKQVAAAYGEQVASSKEWTEALARRNEEADERVAGGQKWVLENPEHPEENPVRAKVTHEDLVAHVNELTPQVVARVEANAAAIQREEFDPVIRPLRVPAKNLSRRGPRIEMAPHHLSPDAFDVKNVNHVDAEPEIADSAMFLDPTDND
jgi:hypothetical protein